MLCCLRGRCRFQKVLDGCFAREYPVFLVLVQEKRLSLSSNNRNKEKCHALIDWPPWGSLSFVLISVYSNNEAN
jgi:hypothetical protein